MGLHGLEAALMIAPSRCQKKCSGFSGLRRAMSLIEVNRPATTARPRGQLDLLIVGA
jgi:hypothetical protein